MEPPATSRKRTQALDRLSDLPDCILEDVILSRLTSRQAVQTSVLSRRWRHLWRAVTSHRVDIDQREFPTACIAELIDLYAMAKNLRREAEQWGRFEELADRLTTLHYDASPTPPLDAFRLRVSCNRFGDSHRWIRRGLARRPAAFHLCCDNDADPVYFGFGFGRGRKFPWFPNLILYPHAGAFTCRLRTLRLSGLRLTSGFMDALTAESPVLENVHLEDCNYGFCRLASRSLKQLVMDACHREDGVDTLVLAVPRLASLRIVHGDAPQVTAEAEMPSLVAASLAHPAGDLGVLWSLRDARSLDLTGFSTAALLGHEDPAESPVFRNLRALLLDACDVGVECQVLRRFLRNAPCLETLTLRNCASSGSFRGQDGNNTVYACENLKWIELEFKDDNPVLELANALGHISKEMVRPIESCVQHGKRWFKLSYA